MAVRRGDATRGRLQRKRCCGYRWLGLDSEKRRSGNSKGRPCSSRPRIRPWRFHALRDRASRAPRTRPCAIEAPVQARHAHGSQTRQAPLQAKQEAICAGRPSSLQAGIHRFKPWPHSLSQTPVGRICSTTPTRFCEERLQSPFLLSPSPFKAQSFTQAPLRLDELMQASTKATPFTPSSTVG